MSPVAWSTFSTGVDPSHHRIYDFLTRDPCTYAPVLTSTDIQGARRVLGIGRYLVPLGRPRIELLRKGVPFWKLLGDRHIPAVVQRVPITFPPEPFNGLLLSGMCVPDLRGSQGTFSFFSTRAAAGRAAFTGGDSDYLIRLQAISTVTPELAKKAEADLRKAMTGYGLSKFELSPGGDKLSLRVGKEIPIAELEKLEPEARWAFWQEELGRCVRCHACREACPVEIDLPKDGVKADKDESKEHQLN